MKEIRAVSFNLGHERVRIARELLLRCGVSAEAELETTGLTSGLGLVALEVNDPRLDRLIDELRKVGEEPHVRAERIYTKRELDSYPWLTLLVATAGLLGGANFDQPYDRTDACAECGAGARPLPPLIADLSRMGKKQLDVTAHDGLLVVTRSLASAVRDAALTGVEFLPARRRSQDRPDPGYLWMRIASEWPPMAPDRVLEIEERCRRCGRAGHFHTYGRVAEYHYDSIPDDANDFGRTWEYFGVWEHSRLGGRQEVILSQRARRCLVASGVRRVRYMPIFIHDHGDV